MGFPEKELDITGRLKIVEKLKCQMLTDVAQLFSGLSESNSQSNVERGDLLADIIILSYLLSKKLGIPYQQIDRRILNKIKLGLIESDPSDKWHQELAELLKHFDLLE